jgi:HEPN domain-containing protein
MNAPQLEAGRWFRQAQADLEVVRTLQAAKHHAAACFYAQQAAEKALKAVLFSQGSRMVLAHSVRELARQCQQHEPAFAEVADEAALLDQFYIPTRYPNGLPSPAIPSESYTATQSEMAQAVAARAVRAVENYLRVHTHVLG